MVKKINRYVISGLLIAVLTLVSLIMAFSVNVYAASLTLDVSPTTCTYGDPITLTATYTPDEPPSEGFTIEFRLNGAPVGTANTDESGTATFSLDATNVNYPDVETYNVTAYYDETLESSPTQLTLTKKALTVTGITASNKVYDRTTAATVDATGANLNGKVGTDDVSLLGTGSATGNFLNADAGTNKTINVSGLSLDGVDKDNYTISPTTTANISQADADVQVSGYNGPYTGTAHGASGTATGVDTENLNSGLSFGSTYTNVPGGSAHWTFEGGTNYQDESGDVGITISKSNQDITFGALANKTYGDIDFTINATSTSELAVSFTAAGDGTVTGNTVHLTGAGSCTITAHQDGDDNYNAAVTVDRSFTIGKANATITVTGFTGPYDGSAHGIITSTAVGVNSENLGSLLTVDPTTYTNVPGGDVNWSFAGNDDYNSDSDTAHVTISLANQTIIITAPSPWTGAAAKDQTIQVTATGGGSANPVVITTDGTVCTGGGNNSATITISAAAGIGHVYFNQAGNANYNAAAQIDNTIEAGKASATVTISGLAQTYDGTAKPVTYVTSPVGLTVDVTYNGSDTAPTNAGSYPIVATINDATYAGSSNGTLEIAKAQPVFGGVGAINVTVGTATKTLAGTLTCPNIDLTGATVTITFNTVPHDVVVGAGGSFTYDLATADLAKATYNITYSYTATDVTNINNANATQALTIKAKTSSSTGGGGGGGAPPVTYTPIAITGLAATGPLSVNTSGIAQAKAHLQSADGAVALDIPQGAQLLTAASQMLTSVSAVKLTALPGAAPADAAALLTYQFGPEGAKFNPGLTLTFAFDAEKFPAGVNENALYIAYWNGTVWEKLTGKLDAAAHTISATISHFSAYGMFVNVPAAEPVPTPTPTPTPTQPVITQTPTTTPAPSQALTPAPTTSPKPTFVWTTPSTTPKVPALAAPANTPKSSPEAGGDELPASDTNPISSMIIVYIITFLVVAMGTIYYVLRHIYLNKAK